MPAETDSACAGMTGSGAVRPSGAGNGGSEGGACRAAALDSGLRRWGRRLGGYRCRSLCGNGPRVPIEAASARHSGEGRNQDAAVGVALRLLERHCVCDSGGVQPVVAATGSGAVPAERLRWIPACAGMTDPEGGACRAVALIPACAGMTDPEAVPPSGCAGFRPAPVGVAPDVGPANGPRVPKAVAVIPAKSGIQDAEWLSLRLLSARLGPGGVQPVVMRQDRAVARAVPAEPVAACAGMTGSRVR